MADNKQGFWSYIRNEGIKNNPVLPWNSLKTAGATIANVTRGVSNRVGGNEWGDNNTTFNEMASGQILPSGTTKTSVSLSIPDLNTVAQADVNNGGVDVSGNLNVGPKDIPQESTEISTPDLVGNIVNAQNQTSIDNLEVEDLAKNTQREKDAESENWLQTARRWMKGRYNSAREGVLESNLESVRQAKEKHFALSYDPDSKNITELVINEPQGWFDDFGNKFFSRGEGNSQIFDTLLSQYNEQSYAIWESDLPYDEKLALQTKLFNAFYDESVNRELFRAFENDHYSDGNVAYALFGDDTKTFGRLKNKFSQEELDKLAKNTGVTPGVYKPTKEEFSAFIDMYQDNQNLASEMSLKGFYGNGDAPAKAVINYRLTEESLGNLRSTQVEGVLQRVRDRLLEAEESGLITPVKRNEIESYFTTVINSNIANAYYWMGSPLAYYTAVKQKDGPLTDGERAILGYGPGMKQLLDDYAGALGRWAEETIDKNIVDGELTHPADSVDGMSINEFFKNAIKDSNIQAGGVDLFGSESAIDAMQHINNNIGYLYWQDKGNLIRRGWRQAQRFGGEFGYTAGELAMMGIAGWTKGIEGLFGTDTAVGDYMLADATDLMNVTTDDKILGSKGRGKLMKRYGLAALDNVPEFGGELWATTLPLGKYKGVGVLGKFGKTKKTVDSVEKMKKAGVAGSKLVNMEKVNNSIRNTLGISAQQAGSRNWLNRAIDATLNATEGKNLTFNNIVKIGKDIGKGIVKDQAIDAIASYYDSEAYSTASFILSTWLTGITEIAAPLAKKYELTKRVSNLWRGADWDQGTTWRVMSYLNKDPEIMAELEKELGKGNVTYNVLKTIASNWEDFEDVMHVAYNQLPEDAQKAFGKLSKDILFQRLRDLKAIDWNSAYGQNLMRILNNKGTNIADAFKYMFGLPGEVEVGGFMSKILLKDGANSAQTRLLKSEYDVALDVLKGGFRNRLEQGFSLDDINQIERRTKYKELTSGGSPKKEYFAEDNGKYFLTSKGAEKFGLDMTNYTEAMAKADAMREIEGETKEFLTEKTQQLMLNKGLPPETINKLASSGGFQKVVDSISSVICK